MNPQRSSNDSFSFQATGDKANNPTDVTDDDEMPIFQNAGDCINPYLGVTVGDTTANSIDFQFKSFTFDQNTIDDTITLVSFF